jgi:hypothetical protein
MKIDLENYATKLREQINHKIHENLSKLKTLEIEKKLKNTSESGTQYEEIMVKIITPRVVKSVRNLQSYLSTVRLRKITVVFEYCEAIETCSRIWVLRGYGNLQSYLGTTRLWKLTVVFGYYEAKETYSRI